MYNCRHSNVSQEIFQQHNSTDGVMRDFCDAYYMKSHPIFSSYRNALQFILFYDDIEIANPLGAKAGVHKLGAYTTNIIIMHTSITFYTSVLLCFGKHSPNLSLNSAVHSVDCSSQEFRN